MTTLRIAILAIMATLAVPQNPPLASVRGIIRRADSGAPLANATVELRQVSEDVTVLYSGITSGDGTFQLINIAPGEYRLQARLAGYLPSEYGQHRWSASGVSFVLSGRQSMSDLQIELTPAGAIAGRITDRSGDSMGATLVQAMTVSIREGQKTLQIVQSGFTNDLGEYRLFGLRPGQYFVSSISLGTTFSGLLNLPNSPGPSRLIPLLTLPAAPAQTPIYFPGTADVRAASPINVVASGTASGINFAVMPSPTWHVRGTVQESGVHVMLSPLNPAPGSAVAPRDMDARNGTFDFADVTPGDYLVIAQSATKEGRVRLDVRDADINNVTVELRTGVVVPTHVTIEGRGRVDSDPGFRNIRFNLRPDPPISGIRGPIYSTFPDGTVNLELMFREGYRIALSPVPDAPPEFQNIYIKSIQLGSRDILNSGLQFDGDPDAKIEIVVGTKTGSLSGTVFNDRQQPSINTTVVLVPDAVRRLRSDAYKTASTDAMGRFQLPQIPPGDYKLFAWDDVEEGAWLDPEFLRPFVDRGAPIRITESSKDSVTLSLTQ